MAQNKYQGTASCTIQTTNGHKLRIQANCFGEFSYQSAKQNLEWKLKAEASSRGGRIDGQISFDIKLQW